MTRTALFTATLRASLLLLAGCSVHAAPRSRSSSPAEADAAVVTIAGGRFQTAGSTSEITYVVDTSTGVCLVTSDRLQGIDLGSNGMATVDCCSLRSIAPKKMSAFFAGRCAAGAAAPAVNLAPIAAPPSVELLTPTPDGK
jgi:hypothetical protein